MKAAIYFLAGVALPFMALAGLHEWALADDTTLCETCAGARVEALKYLAGGRLVVMNADFGIDAKAQGMKFSATKGVMDRVNVSAAQGLTFAEWKNTQTMRWRTK